MQKRLPFIDYLRALAILFVMIVHFPRLRQIFPFLNPWSGVDLFFCISGYVVAKTFVPLFDQDYGASKGSEQKAKVFLAHAKAFYTRRFFRLMPPLVAALVFYLCLGRFFGDPVLSDMKNVWREVYSIFTYTANVYMAYLSGSVLTWHWSLSAEEQFYLVFPFFILLAPHLKSRVKAVLVAIFVVSFLLRPFMIGGASAPASMYLPHLRCDGLLYGTLIFFMSEQPWFKNLRIDLFEKSKTSLLAACMFLSTVILLAPEMALNFSFSIPIICTASAGLLLIALTAGQDPLQGNILGRVLGWIGLRSYGLYLYHVPVVRLTQQFEAKFYPEIAASYVTHILLVFGVLFICVEGTFQFIEKPMIRRGQKYSKDILAGLSR